MIDFRERIGGVLLLFIGVATLGLTGVQVYNQEVLVPQLQARIQELKTQNTGSIAKEIDTANQSPLLLSVFVLIIGAATTLVGGLATKTIGDDRGEFIKQKYLAVRAISEATFRLRISRNSKETNRNLDLLIETLVQHATFVPERVVSLVLSLVNHHESIDNSICDSVINSCKKYLSAEKSTRSWEIRFRNHDKVGKKK